MPLLELRICGARNLKNTEMFGKIDPYCTVALENKQWRTSACENTTNPEWNEVFKFNVSDENSSRLHFVVWDKNMVSDDFLGEYHLSISGLVRGEVLDKWVLLQNCKGNAELHVRVLAVDFGGLSPTDLTPPHPEFRPMPQGYVPPQGYGSPQQQGYPQQGGYPQQQQEHHRHHHGEGQYQQQGQYQQGGQSFGGIEQFFGRPIRLRTAHGTFVKANSGEGARIETTHEPREWETFYLEPRGNGGFIIRTFHGTYIRAHPGGEGAGVDTSREPREWETWSAEPAGGQHEYAFRSIHGTHLRAHPGHPGHCDMQSNRPGEWERFHVLA